MKDDAKITRGLKMVSNAARAGFMTLFWRDRSASHILLWSSRDDRPALVVLPPAEVSIVAVLWRTRPWLHNVLSNKQRARKQFFRVNRKLDVALEQKRSMQRGMRIFLSASGHIFQATREYA